MTCWVLRAFDPGFREGEEGRGAYVVVHVPDANLAGQRLVIDYDLAVPAGTHERGHVPARLAELEFLWLEQVALDDVPPAQFDDVFADVGDHAVIPAAIAILI